MRAKNHHIVPQVLQKQFAILGDEKRIWRSKKTSSSIFQSIERKRIEKTFVIRDYYTILENNRRSDRVEVEFYSKIDDFLGRILPEIIETLNCGEIPQFPEVTLDSIRDIVLHMAKRTPDFLPLHNDVEMGRELIETTLKHLPQDSSSAERRQMESDLKNDFRLKDKGRDIRVAATLNHSPRVNGALAEFVPRWAISETKHSFILSSRMVYRIGNGGPNGIRNPKMEMWMPVTPKIALVLLRDPHNEIPHRVVEAPVQIRKINEYASKNSFEVASHSEKLLKSLLRL